VSTSEPAIRVTRGELYRGFLHAGARGFGGTLPWARRMLVEERRWLTAQEFTDAFSLCNFLPGPNIVNMSIVVGARYGGAGGALAAFAGLLTVPFSSILVLAVLYARLGQLPAVEPMLRGVGAAAGGLVLATGLKMATPLLRTPRALGFLVATLAAMTVLRVPLVLVLFSLAPLSILVAWRRGA
jgi:chromate transporter